MLEAIKKALKDRNILEAVLPDNLTITFEYDGKSGSVKVDQEFLLNLIESVRKYLVGLGLDVNVGDILGIATTVWKAIKKKQEESSNGEGHPNPDGDSEDPVRSI